MFCLVPSDIYHPEICFVYNALQGISPSRNRLSLLPQLHFHNSSLLGNKIYKIFLHLFHVLSHDLSYSHFCKLGEICYAWGDQLICSNL